MKKRFALVMFVLLPLAGWGQLIFNRTFSGPSGSNQSAYSSTVDSAGNIYVVGHYRYNTPFAWLTLMKLDSAGNLLWSKADSFAFMGRKIKTLSDGNLMILGLVQENWPPYYRNSTLLLKTDTAGNTLWSRLYYDTLSFGAVDFVEMPDKGFILTGGRYDLTNQDEGRIFLMRTDSVGAVLWCKLYGNGYPGYYPRSVVSTHDGGFMVGGNMVDIEDIVVFRTDSVGNLVWSKQFGGAKNDRLESLIALSNGNYAFGGSSNSFLGAGSWPPHAYLLLQFDSSGNTVFCKQYPTGQSEMCTSISQAHDNGIIMNGHIAKIKVDTSGIIKWYNAAGAGFNVLSLPNGNILYTGTDGIYWLIKADSLGNQGCQQGILFIPQQVSLQESLTPFILNEASHQIFDSLLVPTLFSFIINSVVNCITMTGTPESNRDIECEVYPNPFQNYLKIKFHESEVTDYRMIITDAVGRERVNSTIINTNAWTLNTKSFEKGVYFIRLFSGTSAYKSVKVVKL